MLFKNEILKRSTGREGQKYQKHGVGVFFPKILFKNILLYFRSFN